MPIGSPRARTTAKACVRDVIFAYVLSASTDLQCELPFLEVNNENMFEKSVTASDVPSLWEKYVEYLLQLFERHVGTFSGAFDE
jgi:lipase chaperone LimK